MLLLFARWYISVSKVFNCFHFQSNGKTYGAIIFGWENVISRPSSQSSALCGWSACTIRTFELTSFSSSIITVKQRCRSLNVCFEGMYTSYRTGTILLPYSQVQYQLRVLNAIEKLARAVIFQKKDVNKLPSAFNSLPYVSTAKKAGRLWYSHLVQTFYCTGLG